MSQPNGPASSTPSWSRPVLPLSGALPWRWARRLLYTSPCLRASRTGCPPLCIRPSGFQPHLASRLAGDWRSWPTPGVGHCSPPASHPSEFYAWSPGIAAALHSHNMFYDSCPFHSTGAGGLGLGCEAAGLIEEGRFIRVKQARQGTSLGHPPFALFLAPFPPHK